MKVEHNDVASDGVTPGTRTRVRVPAFIGLGVLAALSLLEAFAPQTKWFTFPAMVVLIIFLVAARIFYRTREVTDIVRAGADSIRAKDTDPNGPIHPR